MRKQKRLHLRPSRHRDRPEWWPEDENWPPAPRRMRQRFNRRLGFGFFLGIAGFTAIIILITGTIARALGYLQFPHPARNSGSLIGGTFLFALIALFLAGHRFNRASKPFGDLLETANRVANGDYSARVKEQGPSELRTLARAFNEMVDKVETSNTQRQDLMTDITHELRTPLTIIKGNIEGIMDGVYPADQTQMNAILEEVDILSTLIDDLRILALAESGSLPIQKESTDLMVLIGETIASFRPESEAANITLTFKPSFESLLVNVDSRRIRQVLVNVLSNAIHHTPKNGNIKVSISSIGVHESKQTMISVSDSGSGISQEELPYIFDRFYKASDSDGMGLGLAISRKIIEAHNGQIKAESQPDQGTTIIITLPNE